MNAPSGSLNDLSMASKPSGLKASIFPCPFQRIELVERLGARGRAEQPDGKTQCPRTVQGNPSDRGEHSFLPLFIHAFSRKKNASQSQGTVRVGIDGRGHDTIVSATVPTRR